MRLLLAIVILAPTSAAHAQGALIPGVGKVENLPPAAQEEFDRKYVSFCQNNQPCLGRSQLPLITTPDYYEAIGHRDLAERSRSRSRLRIGLLGFGIPANIVGLGFLVPGILMTAGDAKYHDTGWGLLVPGVALFFGGLASWISGSVIRPRTPSLMEMQDMAAKYNWVLLDRIETQLRSRRSPDATTLERGD